MGQPERAAESGCACRFWPGLSVHPVLNTYTSPAIFLLSIQDSMTDMQNGLKGGIFICVVHDLCLSFCLPLLVTWKRDFCVL